jgi:hypothetical protein
MPEIFFKRRLIICVFFLLLAEPGAKSQKPEASGQNSGFWRLAHGSVTGRG